MNNRSLATFAAITAIAATVLSLSMERAVASAVSFSASGLPSGSGFAVNVSATFTNVGSNLQVDVFNKQAATDPLQVLTGLLWDVSGAGPAGTSLSSALTAAGSGLWTTSAANTPNAELRNSVLGSGDGWQYLAPPSGPLDGSMNFEFGLGASGLAGVFGGLGNDDWGVIGPSSNLAQANLNNKLPMVMSTSASPSSATFVIANFNVDATNITNVWFAFGSAGENNLQGVPEPSSLVLFGLGANGMLLAVRRHRRRAN